MLERQRVAELEKAIVDPKRAAEAVLAADDPGPVAPFGQRGGGPGVGDTTVPGDRVSVGDGEGAALGADPQFVVSEVKLLVNRALAPRSVKLAPLSPMPR